MRPGLLQAGTKEARKTQPVSPDIYGQDFESGSIPSGWTQLSGVPSYTYTPPLRRRYSVSLASTDQFGYIIPAQSVALSVYAQFMITADPASAQLILLYNTGGTVLQAYFNCILNGRLYCADSTDAHESYTTERIVKNVPYHLWCHYTLGSGANSYHSIAFNTIPEEPLGGGKFASITIGASTGDVDQVRLMGCVTSTIFDHVAVSTQALRKGWGYN